MLPYISKLNNQLINTALGEDPRSIQYKRSSLPTSIRYENIINSINVFKTPFKKDAIYYKYVHNNDKLMKLLEKTKEEEIKLKQKITIKKENRLTIRKEEK